VYSPRTRDFTDFTVIVNKALGVNAKGKNISVLDINILLRIIELREKNGSYSAVIERIKGKLMCLIFKLESRCQSYREFAS
jgi:hypothetical protein